MTTDTKKLEGAERDGVIAQIARWQDSIRAMQKGLRRKKNQVQRLKQEIADLKWQLTLSKQHSDHMGAWTPISEKLPAKAPGVSLEIATFWRHADYRGAADAAMAAEDATAEMR